MHKTGTNDAFCIICARFDHHILCLPSSPSLSTPSSFVWALGSDGGRVWDVLTCVDVVIMNLPHAYKKQIEPN